MQGYCDWGKGGILEVTLHTDSVRRRCERDARTRPFGAGTLEILVVAASVVGRETANPRVAPALLEVLFGARKGQGRDAQGKQEEKKGLGKHRGRC